MTPKFYRPAKTVTGPSYSLWFKLLATVVTAVLLGYGINIATRFPVMDYGFWVKMLLITSALMLAVSYYWFLKATTTIDENGITQTGMYNRHVEWRDVRSVKMIGVPFMSAIFPPRLVVRTGVAFATFNGGTREILIEFANIALTYQLRK
ncbi:MAG TPA: hypothetical protein VM406_09650 [Noviherbaspirillum sp.]|nr:hypothetical protein [Noviherbaspirillum sp.]